MRGFVKYLCLMAVFSLSAYVSAQGESPVEIISVPRSIEGAKEYLRQQQAEAAAEAARIHLDSTLTIGLLTCSPGQETYELYGHTALRVRSERDGYDLAYNFGVFDFAAPHFVWRFVLGECDYMLVREPLQRFLLQYAARGSWVREQVLNLSPYEARCVAETLERKSQPDSCVYRYDIFRSNCTTKARDVVEASVRGRVIYPIRARRHTTRTLLHEFTAGHAWAEEGNSLLLGIDVDTLITERDEMFSPIYMMYYADSAMIDGGRSRIRPLVAESRMLVNADPILRQADALRQPSFPFSPAVLGWGLLALGLCAAVWEWRRKAILWPLDVLLLTTQGLAGALLAFMALFSQHPGVASNWQVWVLNPLPLLFVWSVAKADIRHERHVYHVGATLALALFLVFYGILPQDFSQLVLPFTLLLLSRSLLHLLLFRVKPN